MARWVFLWIRIDKWADARYFSGLVLGGVFVFGVLARRNFPAGDPLWPGAGAEIGVVVFDHFVGWWRDPGF